MNRSQQALHFKSLHVKGDPLVLYNIWNAGGAKTFCEQGSVAIATGSWSMAAAQGFEDGEAIPLDLVLQIVNRIATSMDLPVSVDFEGGYAVEPSRVAQNVRRVIQAGAVGINFEDQIVGGDDLYSISTQVERIKAIRKAADQDGIALFINARTDVFLRTNPSTHEASIAEAMDRQKAYAEAGADGFFIPGLTHLPFIKRIVDAAVLPVNTMMMGELSSIKSVADIGVSRVSYGPGPYRNAMSDLGKRFKSLR